MPATAPPTPHSDAHADRRTLRLIALFKGAKALTLLVVAAAAFGLLGQHARDGAVRWLLAVAEQMAAATELHGLRGALGGRLEALLETLVGWLRDASARRLEVTGLLALVYAVILSVEGLGLWFARTWAEWYSVFVTASLIPFELWELVRRATALKVLVLALNVAAVAYLVWRIRRDRERTSHPSPGVRAERSALS